MTNLMAAGLSRDDLLQVSRWWFRLTTSEIVVDAESGGCGSGREHKVGNTQSPPDKSNGCGSGKEHSRGEHPNSGRRI
ncbi:hypothetical protein TB2_043905 [Malus domestica]